MEACSTCSCAVKARTNGQSGRKDAEGRATQAMRATQERSDPGSLGPPEDGHAYCTSYLLFCTGVFYKISGMPFISTDRYTYCHHRRRPYVRTLELCSVTMRRRGIVEGGTLRPRHLLACALSLSVCLSRSLDGIWVGASRFVWEIPPRLHGMEC